MKHRPKNPYTEKAESEVDPVNQISLLRCEIAWSQGFTDGVLWMGRTDKPITKLSAEED